MSSVDKGVNGLPDKFPIHQKDRLFWKAIFISCILKTAQLIVEWGSYSSLSTELHPWSSAQSRCSLLLPKCYPSEWLSTLVHHHHIPTWQHSMKVWLLSLYDLWHDNPDGCTFGILQIKSLSKSRKVLSIFLSQTAIFSFFAGLRWLKGRRCKVESRRWRDKATCEFFRRWK